MQEKASFGKYILQKRKEAGLSQKALAEKLFVSESAVSKWERGLSYPDITLITSLCEALHISERELLTASDDMHQREIEEQSRGYLRILRAYSWVTYLGYAAALIPTFIWGIAAGRLSVFFILTAALAVTFSLINVPVLAKQHRAHKVFWCFYGALILLLVVCRLANVEAESEHWLVMAIPGVSLGLLGVFLPLLLSTSHLKHPLKNHKGLICMLTDTVLIFLLVCLGSVFYADGGSRSLPGNLLLAGLAAVWAWAIFALFRYTRLSRLLKSFLTAELCGLCMFLFQPVGSYTDGQPFSLPEIDFHNWPGCVNGNVGVITMICAAILIVFALIRDIRNRNR